MTDTRASIEPHKITKPIQLLASWLVGLVLIEGIFLYSAIQIGPNFWSHYVLVISGVLNVPIFLTAIFLLQTKFRPQMQDDHYYSQFINAKGQKFSEMEEAKGAVKIRTGDVPAVDVIDGGVKEEVKFDSNKYQVAINDFHPKASNIAKSLEEIGIPVASYFGIVTGLDGPPDSWIITINEDMAVESIHAILVALIPYSGDFLGFRLTEIDYNVEEYEDVYIGSYGQDDAKRVIPIKLDNIKAFIHNLRRSRQ